MHWQRCKTIAKNQFPFAGIKDLVPQQKKDSYEGFEDLIDRCNVWLKERTDILVINMQSVIVQKSDGKTLLGRPYGVTGGLIKCS